jgi:AcrR family transcriptional regulator
MLLTSDRGLTDVSAGHNGRMKKLVDATNGLRERKKLRTREAIIDAALDLFERKGYDATTVEDIAAAADVSPRTFFRYFESKLALVMARSGSGSDHGHLDFGPAIAARPADEDLLEAVRHVVHDELGPKVADPLVAREFQVMLGTPSLRNLAREHFYEEEAGMVAAVAERLGLGPDDLAAQVFTSVIGSTLWAAVNRWVVDGADAERLLPTIDEALAVLAGGADAVAAGAVKRPARRRAR